ncbi:hypothetical protein [Mycobacterium sp.]
MEFAKEFVEQVAVGGGAVAVCSSLRYAEIPIQDYEYVGRVP